MMIERLAIGDDFYYRFLRGARVINSAPGAPKISASEKALLEAVAVHDLENNRLSVRDAMALSHLGSPATLHKRLVRLRNMGLLYTKQKANDRRTKYLSLTPLAFKHFKNLGEALHNALLDETPPA